MKRPAHTNLRLIQQLEKDRDDWKRIAEINSDIIDNLRVQVEQLEIDLEQARDMIKAMTEYSDKQFVRTGTMLEYRVGALEEAVEELKNEL